MCKNLVVRISYFLHIHPKSRFFAKIFHLDYRKNLHKNFKEISHFKNRFFDGKFFVFRGLNFGFSRKNFESKTNEFSVSFFRENFSPFSAFFSRKFFLRSACNFSLKTPQYSDFFTYSYFFY